MGAAAVLTLACNTLYGGPLFPGQDGRGTGAEVEADSEAELARRLEKLNSSELDSADVVLIRGLLPNVSTYSRHSAEFSIAAWYERDNDFAGMEDHLAACLGRPDIQTSGYYGFFLHGLAKARRLQGDRTGAMQAVDQLREFLLGVHDDVLRPQLLNREVQERAHLLLEFGLPSAARRVIAAHVDALTPGTIDSHVATIQIQIELARGRAESAIRSAARFLRREELSDEDSAYVTTLLGQATIAAGQLELGIKTIEKGLAMTALPRTVVVNAKIAAAHALLGLDKWESAREWLATLAEEDPTVTQAARLASARWRVAVRSGESDERCEAELLQLRESYGAFLGEWKDAPVVEGGIGFLASRHRRVLIGDMIRAELETAKELGLVNAAGLALQHVLDAQACGQLARSLQAASPDVDSLSRRLKDLDGGLALLLPVDTETFVFLVDGDGVHLGRAPDRAGLRQSALVAERAIKNQGTTRAELQSSLDKLTRAIFEPELRRRMESWTTIHFDGLDLVTEVPPALLRTSTMKWLGCAREVATWPSSVVALQLARRVTHAPRQVGLLCLLNPPSTELESRRLAQLSFEAGELKGIAALEGLAAPVRIARKSEATLQAAKETRPRWLWIHAHGLFDRSRSRPAGLVLPRSKRDPVSVWPMDIEATFPDGSGPELVFVAACHAGSGTRRLGDDGGYPMGASWILSGAESVILSVGEPHHLPAKQLGVAFWQAAAEGLRPSAALRYARIQLRDSGVDPREFGAFRLVGMD